MSWISKAFRKVTKWYKKHQREFRAFLKGAITLSSFLTTLGPIGGVIGKVIPSADVMKFLKKYQKAKDKYGELFTHSVQIIETELNNDEVQMEVIIPPEFKKDFQDFDPYLFLLAGLAIFAFFYIFKGELLIIRLVSITKMAIQVASQCKLDYHLFRQWRLAGFVNVGIFVFHNRLFIKVFLTIYNICQLLGCQSNAGLVPVAVIGLV